MKKILLVLLLSLFTFTFSSCKKYTEEVIYTRRNIAGGPSYIVSGSKFEDITLVSGVIVILDIHNDLPVARIDDYGFMNAVSLESVKIPDTVWNIGTRAFYNSFLKQCIIPEDSSLNTIDSEAFAYTFVEKIYLPNELYEIGNNAFAFTRLEEVFIPKSVKRMGEDVFLGVRGLTIHIEEGTDMSRWHEDWNSD